MKTKMNFLITILLFCTFAGCSDDSIGKVVNTIPEITELRNDISSLPGKNFYFVGGFSDPSGLKSINLMYEPWFLNKTILLDSLPTNYSLNYNFKVPNDEKVGSEHHIKVTVENSGSITTSDEVVVVLDQDVEKPKIVIVSPLNESTVLINDGNEINFNVLISDRELKEFKVECDFFTETVSLSSDSYTYKKELNIFEPGSYVFKFTAVDNSGNIESVETTVNVFDELKFSKMYITDVDSDVNLVSDLFGIPSLAQPSTIAEETGYVFTARYYAALPNTKVRFISQKTSFAPYSFGADQDTDGVLKIGSDESINPIILEGIGYYEIAIDLKKLTYKVKSYVPADQTFPSVQLIGTGVKVNGKSVCVNNETGANQCFHFKSGKELIKDINNPYRFNAVVELFDEPNNTTNNGFIFNSNKVGWNPFWRFDNGVEPENTVPNNGASYVFSDEKHGTYNLVFDTHLNQVMLTPIK